MKVDQHAPRGVPRPEGATGDELLNRVREQVQECSHDAVGLWRTCSGCFECEDGYPNGYYPHSPDFGCVLGGGCSECGGIGAIWDTIDYDQMARDMIDEDRRERDAHLQSAGASAGVGGGE